MKNRILLFFAKTATVLFVIAWPFMIVYFLMTVEQDHLPPAPCGVRIQVRSVIGYHYHTRPCDSTSIKNN